MFPYISLSKTLDTRGGIKLGPRAIIWTNPVHVDVYLFEQNM